MPLSVRSWFTHLQKIEITKHAWTLFIGADTLLWQLQLDLPRKSILMKTGDQRRGFSTWRLWVRILLPPVNLSP